MTPGSCCSTAGSGREARGRRLATGWLLLLAVSLPLFFWGSRELPFRDPDEGLFGSIAREMVERGDWLTPRFNGLRYLEKPPLFYWLTALIYALSGFTEWGARLWSIVGALGATILTVLLGREVAGPRAGWLAGFVYATALGVFLQTRGVGVDLLFTAFLTLAVLSFLRWTRGGGAAALVALYLAVTLALMTKGALGLLLPAVVIGASLLLARPRPALGRLGLWWGVPLLLGLVLPWHLLADRANPGFLRYYLLETHLVRFLEGTKAIEDEIPLSTAGFLGVSVVWFLPWSLFLPSAVLALARRWRSLAAPERSGWTVLAVWIALVFGLFSLSAFKLEHYSLPALPPLAVLVAHLWSHERPGRLGGVPLAAGAAAALLGAVSFGLARWYAPPRSVEWLAGFDVYYRMLLEEGSPLPLPPVGVLATLLLAMALCLFAGFAAAFGANVRRTPRAAFAALVAGTVGFLFALHALVAEITPYQSFKGVSQALVRLAPSGELILYEGYLENAAGLPFYTGRQVHVLGPARGDLAFGARFPEGRGLFHAPAELAQLWRGPERVFLVTDRPLELSALARIRPEERHLVVADHGKRLYSNRPGSGAVHQEPPLAGAAEDRGLRPLPERVGAVR